MKLLQFAARMRLALFGLTVILAACQQHDAAFTPPTEPDPTPKAAEEAPKSAPVQATESAPAQSDSEQMAAATPPPLEPEPMPLNLTIPTDMLDKTERTAFSQEERRALPNMFDQKKQKGRSVSPGLLFREGEDISMDAVSGAEIKVEIPIN